MATPKAEKLRSIILQYFDRFSYGDNIGTLRDQPDFELYPQDFLGFAEQELEKNTSPSLINCVSHLKRAVDCQLDVFFYGFNLSKIFEERNLKFDKKLEFLKECGIFSPRSLSRLNNIRNRMEHDYVLPKIQEIEVYYDLVAAFIVTLEYFIMLSQFSSEIRIGIDENEEGKLKGVFGLKYDFETPKLIATVEWYVPVGDPEEHLEVTMKEPYEFAYFFKILFLLFKRDWFASEEFVLAKLKE